MNRILEGNQRKMANIQRLIERKYESDQEGFPDLIHEIYEKEHVERGYIDTLIENAIQLDREEDFHGLIDDIFEEQRRREFNERRQSSKFQDLINKIHKEFPKIYGGCDFCPNDALYLKSGVKYCEECAPHVNDIFDLEDDMFD